MKMTKLVSDDSAVSPVIGVILMVAITVILAAVIGSFVLNLGGSLQQNAPQASFGFDYDTSAAPDNVTITHQTGDSIESSELNATMSGNGFNYTESTKFAGTVSAGDSATYELDSGNWSGETVRVIWESEDGESSATLSRSTAPS